jgi:hypothetical protein
MTVLPFFLAGARVSLCHRRQRGTAGDQERTLTPDTGQSEHFESF